MGKRISALGTKVIAVILLLTFLLSATTGCNPSGKYTGTPVKVLIVFIQFTDIADDCPDPAECEVFFGVKNQALILEPRHSASEYRTLLDKGVNEYYQRATYGQVYFDFDVLESSRSNGWWASPHTLTEYNHENPSVKQEGVNIAYTQLGDKVLEYERILVIYGMQGRAGQTMSVHKPTPYYAYPVNFKKDDLNTPDSQESGEIPMIISDVAEDASDNELITIVSHELAHQIGAVDQYYDSFPGMGTWDLMDHDWDFHHFGAWTKLDRQWISWDTNTTTMPCSSGMCGITTTLDPVEVQGNNALLIPIFYPVSINNLFAGVETFELASGQKLGVSSFVGIMAECRMPINGDETIPEKGVLVTFSNPWIDASLAGTVSEVLTNESNPYALLQPGESYYNSKYHIYIVNMSQPYESECIVRAERNIIPMPDVYISQSSSPGDGGYDAYRSIDIWNDISANGLNVYPSYEKVITASTYYGPVTVPEGLGDPITLTENNFVNYLVHNGGDATAKNVKVNVYIRQDMSVTVQGQNCETEDPIFGNTNYLTLPILIGSHIIPELKPGQTINFSEHFKTTLTTPVQIEVEIEPVSGEINTFNNIAYETNKHIYGEKPISIADQPGYNGMGVTLSTKCKTNIAFIAQEVPGPSGNTCEGWDLSIEPASGNIAPGQTIQFNVTGVPAVGAEPGDACRAQVCVLSALSGDTWSAIGCMDFDARVVNPASLTCSIANQTISLGQNVQVAGVLDPQLADTIGLSYIPPEGESMMINVDTNGNGEYTNSFTPDIPGVWNVRASWVGDDSHAPTNSELCRFVVAAEPQEPIFTPSVQANCREGSSVFWKAFGATALGVTYPIVGVSPDGSWYFIQFSESRQCWVKGDTGAASGDLAGVPAVPVREITPTPTPTATPSCVFVQNASGEWVCQ